MNRRAGSKMCGLAAAILIVASACSGPPGKVKVGVKEFPTDVILGAQGVVAEPLPSPRVRPSTPSLVLRVPVQAAPRPTGSGSPSAPSGPCPTAHPFDSPKLEARNRAVAAPVAASYLYRNKGTFDYRQGSSVNAGILPAQSSRTIKDVVKLGTEVNAPYEFKLVEGLAGVLTTTTYRVIPESAVPGEAGLFIQRIEMRRPNLPVDDFEPQPLIKILEFPASPNLNWKSSGTDPTTGVSMTIQGRVGIETPDGADQGTEPDILAHGRVDACGEVIDSWLVEIGGPSSVAAPDPAGGTIIGPTKDLRLKAIYAIATQYGGFSVYDKYQFTGMDGGLSVKLVNEATISELPKLTK